MAEVNFYGNLAADAELRHTPQGSPVLSFRAADNKGKKKDDGSYTTENTTWFQVEVWGSLAEMLFERGLMQGDRVRVVGELQARQFERRDGTRGQNLEVKAWGVQTLTKGRNRPTPTTSPAANTHQPGPGWGNQAQQQQQRGGGWDAPQNDPWNTGGANPASAQQPPANDPWNASANNGGWN